MVLSTGRRESINTLGVRLAALELPGNSNELYMTKANVEIAYSAFSKHAYIYITYAR